MFEKFVNWVDVGINLISAVIVVSVTVAVIAVLVLFIIDITQTKHTIRRNYPVIGRFRYLFEHMGEFFRQYFFAMDREELPFNRADRSWVYRAAKNIETNLSFGSTYQANGPGSVLFVNSPHPIREEDVQPAAEIELGPFCKTPYKTRSLVNISGMSYGAISKPAIQALTNGAKDAGCWINTGEGGLSPYHLESGADVVFQIGTAKYGVRDEQGQLCDDKLRDAAAHEQVRMFEIKLSQGAKPGKGGILPAEKVCASVAKMRGIPEGQASISPNAHTDINSPADLLDMIARVRNVTGKPVGFKAVISAQWWLDELFNLINERGIESAPDFITVDGGDGGTGAAPASLMDHVGLTLVESLPMLVDALTKHGLRERTKVIASGKMITPARVAWAMCMGADFVISARGFMFSLGCIQALQCNKNTCPTGITTHDKKLQKGLNPADKRQRVKQYAQNLEKEVGIIAHACGVTEARQLRRHHARLVIQFGHSKPLDELHPPLAAKFQAADVIQTDKNSAPVV
ncbi:MAG: FMN-binding glutamate synthase family protein [Pseudomonadales bacterium]|nr:FMN-binding glutamate synthase family protein [Pseudomonadales bacterium]